MHCLSYPVVEMFELLPNWQRPFASSCPKAIRAAIYLKSTSALRQTVPRPKHQAISNRRQESDFSTMATHALGRILQPPLEPLRRHPGHSSSLLIFCPRAQDVKTIGSITDVPTHRQALRSCQLHSHAGHNTSLALIGMQ